MFGNGYFGNGYYGDGWFGPIVDTGTFLLVQDTGSGQDQLLVNLGQTADYFGNSYFSHGYLAGGYFGPPSGDKTIAILDSGGVLEELLSFGASVVLSDQNSSGDDSLYSVQASVQFDDFGQAEDSISESSIFVTIPIAETASGFDSSPVSQEDFKQLTEFAFGDDLDPFVSVSLNVEDGGISFEPTSPIFNAELNVNDAGVGAEIIDRDGHVSRVTFTKFLKKRITFELK